MKSYLGRNDLPRGLRNNNPGNIRFSNANAWTGKIPYAQNTDYELIGGVKVLERDFEQFTAIHYGIRAKMVLIYNKVNGGFNTISKLITVYAPPNENNTVAYISQVAKMMGISTNAVIELNEESLLSLCKAISLMENGSKYSSYVTDSDYKDALAIFDKPLKKKAKITRSK